MSRYRSELPGLLQRISDLERELRELRARQVQHDAQRNLGPQAHGAFSRFMYFLGRGIAHLVTPRTAALRRESELAAARERVRWLERRVATLREEAGDGR